MIPLYNLLKERQMPAPRPNLNTSVKLQQNKKKSSLSSLLLLETQFN